MRKISVMKLNASVNGGTAQAPRNTLASAACRIVERNAPTTIQTITRTSQSGCRNSDSPAPTSTPLKPKSPARIAPRSIPITIAVSVETTRPSAPAKPSHASATNIATRIARPVTGLFMKQTWPTPRRQESTKSSRGRPLGALRPLRHRPVDLGQTAWRGAARGTHWGALPPVMSRASTVEGTRPLAPTRPLGPGLRGDRRHRPQRRSGVNESDPTGSPARCTDCQAPLYVPRWQRPDESCALER